MAAEIQRQDIIDDDALMAPLILSKNLEVAVKSLSAFSEAAKQNLEVTQQREVSMKKASDTLNSAAKVSEEYAKTQNKIVAIQAKNTAENIAIEKSLQKANEQYKLKIALGERDTKEINKQNASIRELNAALNANRKAYSDLRTEEERNSKEGKALLKTIQDQDAAVKELKKSIGQNQDNVGNYEGAIKGLKDQLKAARDEMAGIAVALGTDSKEFEQAAEKAGALKDEIGDLADAVKDVSGSKLENLSATFGSVFGKLKSGDFGGALDSAKQFAAVSKSISFAEAGKSLSQFGQTMGIVGKAILTNPIFLLAAVIVGIITAIYKFRDSIVPVKYAMDILGDAIDYVTGKIKEFTDWIGLTTFAQEEAAKKTIEYAQAQIEATKKYYDFAIKIADASGDSIVAMEREKWQEIAKLAEAGIKASFDPSKSLKDQSDEYKTFINELATANNELAVINAKLIKEQKDLNKLLKESFDTLKLEEYNKMLKLNKDATRGIADAVANLKPVFDGVTDEILINIDTVIEAEEGVTQAMFEEARKQVALRKRANDELKELRLESTFEAIDIASALGNSLSQIYVDQSNERLSTLQSQMDAEIIAAGKNEEAKLEIQRSYAKQFDDIRKQQSEAQRRNALFQKLLAAATIIINTNLAATAALAPPPIGYGPTILGASVAAGIKRNGALQLAELLATAIPFFKKGTDSAPGGLAVVGEEGSEMIITPSGDVSLSPSEPTLIDLPAGSKVVTHEDTVKVLAHQAMRDRIEHDSVPVYDFGRLEREIADLKQIIKNKKETHINITQEGLRTAMKTAETRTWFMDNLYK